MGFVRYEQRPTPCPFCAGRRWRLGKLRSGAQRYVCADCGRHSSNEIRAARTPKVFEARMEVRSAADFLTAAGVLLAAEARPRWARWVTRVEASREWGVTRERVRQLVNAGRCESFVCGPYVFVNADARPTHKPLGKKHNLIRMTEGRAMTEGETGDKFLDEVRRRMEEHLEDFRKWDAEVEKLRGFRNQARERAAFYAQILRTEGAGDDIVRELCRERPAPGKRADGPPPIRLRVAREIQAAMPDGLSLKDLRGRCEALDITAGQLNGALGKMSDYKWVRRVEGRYVLTPEGENYVLSSNKQKADDARHSTDES